MFACRTREFCPSCHAKRLEEWGEWMRDELLLDVPPGENVAEQEVMDYLEFINAGSFLWLGRIAESRGRKADAAKNYRNSTSSMPGCFGRCDRRGPSTGRRKSTERPAKPCSSRSSWPRTTPSSSVISFSTGGLRRAREGSIGCLPMEAALREFLEARPRSRDRLRAERMQRFLPLARGLGEESEEINLLAILDEPSPRPRRV